MKDMTRRTMLQGTAAATTLTATGLVATQALSVLPTKPTQQQLETYLSFLHFESRFAAFHLGYMMPDGRMWVPVGPAQDLHGGRSHDELCQGVVERTLPVLRTVGLEFAS